MTSVCSDWCGAMLYGGLVVKQSEQHLWPKSCYKAEVCLRVCGVSGSVLGIVEVQYMLTFLLAIVILENFPTVCLNERSHSYYQIARTSTRTTQSSTDLFQLFLCFGSWPTSTQGDNRVKSDPSVQLSLNVYKCPLLSTEHGRVCIDVFALFKRMKRISSGLSFEFTGLLIIDHNSLDLLNIWIMQLFLLCGLSHLIFMVYLEVNVLMSKHYR